MAAVESVAPSASSAPEPAAAVVDAGPSQKELAEAARQRALREAAEFGMLNMLGGDAGGIGDPGVGNVLTIGRTRERAATPPRPVTVRFGSVSVTGSMPSEVVQRLVRRNAGRYRLCYEEGLQRNPSLQGRVTVRFVIGRDGSVQTAQSSSSDLPDYAVVQCAIAATRSIAFPQPTGGGIVVASVPIVMSRP